ncbi:MAG: hypothetical protein OXU68_07690, partial [Bacteroidota bacterium]|nr:hypothetical protein [Bacteroidota bacterium]
EFGPVPSAKPQLWATFGQTPVGFFALQLKVCPERRAAGILRSRYQPVLRRRSLPTSRMVGKPAYSMALPVSHLFDLTL